MSRRLITIPISHYCERARWALDWAGLDYVEERHLQMFHARPVRRATRGSSTTPVLIDGDQVFADSADIVDHADAIGSRPLYPTGDDARAAVSGVERDLAGEFGVESRRLAYHWFLDQPKALLRYNNAGAPLHERVAIRIGFRFARRIVTRYLEITPQTVARAVERVARHLDAIAERIADRDYLCGDEFTAADLTFAALSAPLVLPPEYGARLPDPSELPSGLQAEVARYRAHPAGAFALKMYRSHRRP